MTTKFKSLLPGITLLLLSLPHYTQAAVESIEWHNQNGQIFIDKSTYTQATFNMQMCSMQKLKECRLFFASYTAGAPAVGSGITIASGKSLTDTQYAAALATFTGKLLALSADNGLCIWLYAKGTDESLNRQNCGPSGMGIQPIEPVLPSCSAIGGPVEIAYGEIQAKDVPNIKKSNNLMLSCDASVSVKVSINGYTPTTGIKLRTDDSLTAIITIRDQPGNIGSVEKVVAKQVTIVPITSELKTNGNLAGGSFRGSAIISIDIL
jgi:hypothetical protein